MITLCKTEERGQGSGERAFLYLMGHITLVDGPGCFPMGRALFGKGATSQPK